MKKNLLFFIVVTFVAGAAGAQSIDSFFFNLYTDSLKKGTHNYINLDGKLDNGRWMPLTDKQLLFTTVTPGCSFEGNDLVVPAEFSLDKVVVKAALRSDTSKSKEVTIYIKKMPDPELPTEKEVRSRKRNG